MFAKVKYLLAIGFLFLIPACATGQATGTSNADIDATVEARLAIIPTPTPQIITQEIEVIVEKEVPIETEVIKEVIVEKEVVIEVPVEKIVEKEKTVVQVVEVVKEVQVVVTATPTPMPTATPMPTEMPLIHNVSQIEIAEARPYFLPISESYEASLLEEGTLCFLFTVINPNKYPIHAYPSWRWKDADGILWDGTMGNNQTFLPDTPSVTANCYLASAVKGVELIPDFKEANTSLSYKNGPKHLYYPQLWTEYNPDSTTMKLMEQPERIGKYYSSVPLDSENNWTIINTSNHSILIELCLETRWVHNNLHSLHTGSVKCTEGAISYNNEALLPNSGREISLRNLLGNWVGFYDVFAVNFSKQESIEDGTSTYMQVMGLWWRKAP